MLLNAEKRWTGEKGKLKHIWFPVDMIDVC